MAKKGKAQAQAQAQVQAQAPKAQAQAPKASKAPNKAPKAPQALQAQVQAPQALGASQAPIGTLSASTTQAQVTYRDIPLQVITKDGNPWKLTEEQIHSRIRKLLGMGTTSNIYIPGYMDGTGHSFHSVFGKEHGISWNQAEKLLMAKNQGTFLTISTGSHGNHYGWIIPKSSIKAQGIGGQEIHITQENWRDFPIMGGRHGRIYNMGRLLAFRYRLLYISIPNGTYNRSNGTNWNFQYSQEQDLWRVWTARGNLVTVPNNTNPLYFLDNPQELAKVIGL